MVKIYNYFTTYKKLEIKNSPWWVVSKESIKIPTVKSSLKALGDFGLVSKVSIITKVDTETLIS